MSTILGLNYGHADSSASLLVDGELVLAVAEERLGNRVKHDPRFPANAVDAVLNAGNVRLKDIDYVAIPRRPWANLAAKAIYSASHMRTSLSAALTNLKRAQQESTDLTNAIARATQQPTSDARYRVVHVEHHLAHIASAYYCSPFESTTAGLSYDGSGDFASLMAARCEGTKITILDRVTLPHSLGFFYTAICQLIGFPHFGEEYKVMGLAAYGEDSFHDEMESLLELPADSWFRLKTSCFRMHEGGTADAVDDAGRVVAGPRFTHRLQDMLGIAPASGGLPGKREKDLAHSAQVRFEKTVLHCAERLHNLVSSNQIAYAGGCALNGVANARLLRDTAFSKYYIQPAASDDGCSLGAALWTWHNVVGGKTRFHMKHAYWGPSYAESHLKDAASSAGTPYRLLADSEVVPVVARLLRSGLLVGWYQGRSEWGPRALGNRSILADPTRPDTRDIINTRIKRRESFRPFAPTVLSHAVDRFFEQDILSPFMMHVVKVRASWRDKLPAITHIDGTGRLQSIERETNPLYYDLIDGFSKLSGVPILLNTSFNENEPVVDTPEQAVACYLRTDLDALCLGKTILVKPQHRTLMEETIESSGEALVFMD